MHKIFSVDDHIIEPADLWTSRLPARYREIGPRVVDEGGREFWAYEDQRVLTVGLNAVAGHPRDQWNSEPTRFADMIPGCYDPKERARDMLSQGVLASVCFPTLPRFGGMLFNSFADKQLAYECVKAWNDFVLDEWCPSGPAGLYVPMVITTVWDPELGAREIRRCADKGAKAVCFTENPAHDGLPGFHAKGHWDPVWQVCEEAGLPICMHIGSSGFVPLIDPEAPFTAAMAGIALTGQLAMINLLLSGVCERYPRIKIVWSEAGIGWVPAALERLDRQFDRHDHWVSGPGRAPALLPSELFARNMWACMIEEPQGIKLYEMIGEDKILSEIDYPHADTPFPFTQRAYADILTGLPDEIVAKVTHRNAEKLFGWTMADESLCADISVPDDAASPGTVAVSA